VCFLIGKNGEILYADFSQSPTAMPDKRQRWQAVWNNRENLAEIAHSHPLGGSRFSQEDETTMAALDLALGQAMRYSVVTPEEIRVRQGDEEFMLEEVPWWVALMRLASGVLEKE